MAAQRQQLYMENISCWKVRGGSTWDEGRMRSEGIGKKNVKKGEKQSKSVMPSHVRRHVSIQGPQSKICLFFSPLLPPLCLSPSILTLPLSLSSVRHTDEVFQSTCGQMWKLLLLAPHEETGWTSLEAHGSKMPP